MLMMPLHLNQKSDYDDDDFYSLRHSILSTTPPFLLNLRFSMTRIFVRFDAHLDQMTQITITTASWWTQSCVRSTCF